MNPARGSISEEAPAFYENLLSNLPEAVIAVDSTWRILYANQSAAQIAGKAPEEMPGRSFWDEWPEFTSAAGDLFRQAMQARVSIKIERQTSPGTWLEFDAQPAETGLVITYRNITAHKRSEQDLRERTTELTDLIENATVPLHCVGPDGRILWANEAEMRLLGYSVEEYIGCDIRNFHVDPPVIADILQRLKGNEELHGYEARVRRRDGAILRVAIDSSGYFRDGQFIHSRCFTRDITSERDAADLQQRLAAIVESSDDAIISKDLNGIIQSWNRGAERLFGYTAQEAIGKPISMLAVPERADEIPNILERLARGERIDHFQTKRRAKDGRVLSISLTVSPIRDISGRIIGASKVARDVTELERHQEAVRAANTSLTRANSDLEQFAYSASHDLQEPLRMVSAYGELLQKRFAGQLGPSGDEYIGFIVEGAARMERLLRDLRAFTQISTVSDKPADDVDAEAVLRRCLVTLSSAIEECEAEVTHGPIPRLHAFEFQIEQLFQNLIGNALRYRSQEPPRIHVAVERCGQQWQFSVRDNGIGIEPRYQELIFGIFKRLHTAADYPGTGMGLAICQRIVERAGGRIWVQSELGCGSTFFFTMPASGK